MNYRNKTKKDLIKELQELQKEHNSLKTSYEKDITERRQVEEALKFTRLILNNAADTMAIIDYDGRYIDVNEAFCRSVGYSREELLSMTMHDIDPNYPAGIWPGFMEKLKQAGSLNFESLHRTSEGKLIPVEITVSFFEHNGKEYHCGFARDITERKRAEKERQVALTKYKTLFNCFPFGITVSDETGKILEVNQIAEKLLGVSQDEHIERDIDSPEWHIVRPDGTPMLPDEYASVRALKEKHIVENVKMGIVKPDNTTTWISVNAAPLPLEGYGVVIAYNNITERKLAEESLRESEERFRLLSQGLFEGIVIHDEGKIIDANEAFVAMFGYDLPELIGKNALDFATPELREIAERHIRTGSEEPYEGVALRKEGSTLDVEVRGKNIPYKGRMVRVTALMDVSERKQAEVVLHLEKENFRNSLDDSPLGVRIATIEGDTIYANKALLDLYGYDSLGELQKKPLKDRYTPESYVEAQERKHQREQGDLSATGYEIDIIRKNGEIRHLQVFRKEVLWDGVRQFQVIYIDITERLLAEKTLRESKEKFRNITEQVADVIFMTNKRGHFTYISPSATSLFGYSQEEMISMSFVKFLAKSEATRAMTEFNLSMRSGQKRENHNFLMKHKDGSTFTGELTANAFYENDMVTGIIGVIRNITERLQAEEEIRKSKILLEDLHKHLNEIRENERALISREIHDQIGQSLTALKLDLNRMQEHVSTNPEVMATLEGMIELVSKTIKDVQRISSDLRPGILDDLGLAAAIEWYCGEFEERTGIRCSLRLDDSIFGDSQKNLVFFRVLQEALTNVIRHANASSVSIILHQSKQGTTMTIQDNGIGIHPGKVESGKSLGLIGMRERVKQFEGKVDIASNKEQGTKLTIFIPFK